MNNIKTFNNPILPGFYPDPSICRVGDDYYLVNSSFSYFPGVPIFHSKDLVNWNQIGHVLDRSSQLPLDGAEQSQGIFAPTIRHYNGIYYMITTNISNGGNFIVTATDPKGPWSEPYYLENCPGIDPSLFFDHDGKVYYCGTRSKPEEKYYGDWEVWLQELDINEMKLVGPSYSLWDGAIVNSVWPEGPHIYKIGEYYYVMIAEGGTCIHHSITIARSKSILGPYEGNPSNPIITHRNLGSSYPIINVGHGDLVETQNNEWWMVFLASRPYDGGYYNLGRETFLLPITWEDGWPLVSAETGKVEFSYPVPNLPQTNKQEDSPCTHFDTNILDFTWNFIRIPLHDMYRLTENNTLRMKVGKDSITTLGNPSFLGRRQQHINFTAKTSFTFMPKDNEHGGIVLQQNHKYNLRFVVTKDNEGPKIMLIRCYNGEETVLASKYFKSQKVVLKVTSNGQSYNFYYGTNSNAENTLIENVDGRLLSTNIASGFIGAYIGMYASSNGIDSSNFIDFNWFEYYGNK